MEPQGAAPESDRSQLLGALTHLFAETHLEERELIRIVAQRVAAVTGDACTVRVLSEDEQWLLPGISHHPNPAISDALRPVSESTLPLAAAGLWKPVIEEGRLVSLSVSPQGVDMEATTAQLEFVRSTTVRAILGVPLFVRQRLVGGIALLRYASQAFNALDERFLRDLAAAISLVIENVRLSAAALRAREAEQVAHAQLEQAQTQLRAREPHSALAGAFGVDVHALHNLLLAIGSHTELVHEDLRAGAPAGRALDELHAAVGRATSLSAGLLRARPRIQATPGACSLNAHVARSARVLRRLLGERIELALELEPALLGCMLEPELIEPLLLELCVNARDAMPQGGRLTLATANHLAAGATRYVRLSVRDSGVGMDRPTLTRLFEPFFSTKPDAAGLGLYGVSQRVQQAGGCVTVDSAPGCGSTLHLYLPAEPSAPLPAARVRPATAHRGPVRAQLGLPHGSRRARGRRRRGL